MGDFTVSGKSFKTRRMDVFMQANVARRFGRLGFIMVLVQDQIKNGRPLSEAINGNIPAIMMALGSMDDPDVEYIRNACLDIVEFNANGAWVRLRAGEALAWGDMQLMDLCQILAYVIKDVFFPFFQGLAAISPSETENEPVETPQVEPQPSA